MLYTETARELRHDAENALRSRFCDAESRGYRAEIACAPGAADAVFLSADRRYILAVSGLPFYMPACRALLADGEIDGYIRSLESDVALLMRGRKLEAAFAGGEALDVPKRIGERAARILNGLRLAPGLLNEKGEHVVDPSLFTVGTHFGVNLLLGDRVGCPSPLLTTPKGACDTLGRGSFRGEASRQVTSTMNTLVPENNGEPCNRGVYLSEGGRQIFFSGDPHTNVKSAVCTHSCGYTVIEYELRNGLSVRRTLFVPSHREHRETMPDALEAQTVEIKNLTDETRTVKAAFTGMFGLASQESAMNDAIYASVTWQSGIVREDGIPVAVCPRPKPGYLKRHRRFATLHTEGETGYFDSFMCDYAAFVGSGSVERPQMLNALDCAPVYKTVPFFALGRSFDIKPRGTVTVTVYTGLVAEDADEAFHSRLGAFVGDICKDGAARRLLSEVTENEERFASAFKVDTGDAAFDAYVSRNLPYQVKYQAYISRSFAWTQKAFREIGFREIQDLTAAIPYFVGCGLARHAKTMLSEWVKNVYSFGYANHNFYYEGKEAGIASDDALWLFQAVHAYVTASGDVGFLDEKYDTADKKGERTVFDTLEAILRYSGEISVGAHGLPLMDRADWNDCMKLDSRPLTGPEKEALYASGELSGTIAGRGLSESVMNAFLLTVAYDLTAKLAAASGRDAAAYSERAEKLRRRVRSCAYINGFYARALINAGRGYTYLGSRGDGLSSDGGDGTYWLNSFTWSLLSGTATERETASMLSFVETKLKTRFGLKLCTPNDLGRLGSGASTGNYFDGDRENGGVFKHAEMMFAAAALSASKKVKSKKLSRRLSSLAFFAVDGVMPYRMLDDPYLKKGNPRFCTQYVNSDSGEHIGPMLSGTASWLSTAVREIFGCADVSSPLSPLPLPRKKRYGYTLKTAGGEFEITVVRGGERGHKIDGKPFDGVLADIKGKHAVEVTI